MTVSGVRWFPSTELQQLSLSARAIEALRMTHTNVDIKPIGQAAEVRSDSSGVFSAYNVDLVVQFLNNTIVIATATIHGVLDTGAGTFTLTNTAVTGEKLTIAYYGNGTASARAEVTHVTSLKVGRANFTAVDQSVGGSTVTTTA